MFFPGRSSTNCLAMSLHLVAFLGILDSHSHLLSAQWAYRGAGVAWVILVVVTNPGKSGKISIPVCRRTLAASSVPGVGVFDADLCLYRRPAPTRRSSPRGGRYSSSPYSCRAVRSRSARSPRNSFSRRRTKPLRWTPSPALACSRCTSAATMNHFNFGLTSPFLQHLSLAK